MQDITLPDMLRVGLHFGHQTSRWNPRMKSAIYTARGGISIVDLERTKEALEGARTFLEGIAQRRGVVLFVGTKRQAAELTLAAASRAGMPHVTKRWVGGTLTNFKTIHALLAKLEKLKEQRGSGGLTKYTKKEQLRFAAEIERLEGLVGGLVGLERMPDALFVIDVKQERTAVHEARRMNVPVVALVDTNGDPEGIAYVIPGNDDATRAVQYVLDRIVEAIESGRAKAAAVPAEAPVAAVEAAAPVVASEPLTDEPPVPPAPSEAIVESDPVVAAADAKDEPVVVKEVPK